MYGLGDVLDLRWDELCVGAYPERVLDAVEAVLDHRLQGHRTRQAKHLYCVGESDV